MQDDNDQLGIVFKMIPFEQDAKKQIVKRLNDTIHGVFMSNIKFGIFQALYTWIIFDFAQINYVYLYTLLAAFFKCVPIASTSIFGIFGGLQMWLSHDRHPLLALALSIAYMYVDQKVYTDVYERDIKVVNPMFMGMSVFMGYYAFDLQGIFYGPLLVCAVTIFYDLFNRLAVNKDNRIVFR